MHANAYLSDERILSYETETENTKNAFLFAFKKLTC